MSLVGLSEFVYEAVCTSWKDCSPELGIQSEVDQLRI